MRGQRGGTKSYNYSLDVYLHFQLFVEVIQLTRILDLLMALDVTYCVHPSDLWIGRNIPKVECQTNMKT
jgi:hypothetical protein